VARVTGFGVKKSAKIPTIEKRRAEAKGKDTSRLQEMMKYGCKMK
jgi:hypothetical protein